MPLRCPGAQPPPRPSAVHPAEHRRQAQQQLLGQEGLGDVVVRPQAKATEPVLILVPGREEQNRHGPALPQLPEQGKSVPVWEIHVQQHRVRVSGLEALQGLGAGESGVRLISRLGQDLLYHVLQFVLVIHDQNAIGHIGPPFSFFPHYSKSCPSVQTSMQK